MFEIRQSTPGTYPVGVFVDKTDGLTPETAITLSAADEKAIKKAGHGTVHSIADRSWSAITGMDGYYDIVLSSTDSNTLGPMLMVVQDDSVCLPVYQWFGIVSQNYFDTKYGADRLQVDVREKGDANLGLTTQEKADVDTEADEALTNYDPPTRAELTTDKNSIITEIDANETKIDTIDGNVDTINAHITADYGSTEKAAIDLLDDSNYGLQDLDTELGKIPQSGGTVTWGLTAANAIADALLKRDIDQVETAAPIHSLAVAILKAVSRVKDDSGTLKTYKTDGTTVKMSQTITTDSGNEPIDELTAGA